MTTKILTGTDTSGYSLSASVSILSITSAGMIEGAGLTTGAAAAIHNAGRIAAAAGVGGSKSKGNGGVASDDFPLAGGNVFTNSGPVTAGRGGGGYARAAFTGNGGAICGFSASLGHVDGFDQDHGASKQYEGTVISFGFLATQRDTLEPLQLSKCLLDPGPPLVQFGSEETRDVFGVLAIGNDWADAALASGEPIGVGIIAFVSKRGARVSIGSNF